MGHHFKSLLLALVVLAFCGSDSIARSVVPPAESVSELTGAWLGESDFTEYVRMQLNGSGSGQLAIQWVPGGKADLYEIQEFSLREYKIKFRLRPLSDSESVLLAGTATATSMNLKLRGEKRWERTLKMRREEYILGRIQAVKDAFAGTDELR